MPPPSLTVQLFGPLRVLIGGEPLPRLRTRSIEWLLALLVLRHGRAVDRSWLAGTLWPESDGSQALHNLRDGLVHLRKALGPERARLQSPTRDSLRLDLAGAEVDLVRFDAALKAGDEASLCCAVELHTRPLLEGCLEPWVLPEREHREQACLAALETLADSAERRGDYATALGLLRRAESLDNLRDSLQRQLMRVLAASGDTPAALLAYREYRLRLHRELNVEPDPDTTRLFQQIRADSKSRTERRGDGAGRQGQDLPVSSSSRHSLTTSPSHPLTAAPLPHPITALIGREQDVQDVVAQIAASRLVTLAGAGGVGKTRLALEAATEVAGCFPEGAAFVALASLSDPALLPSFVATALGLREEGANGAASLLEALMAWLAVHPVLLVLDNCEHLVEAAAALCQTLLERCPRLQLLATSRQRLGLTGEVVWRVPSLPAPDPEALPSEAVSAIQHVLRFPAAQLLIERAAAVRPGFRLRDRDEALAVARLCRRLDGIPLALELAAARTRVLSLAQIAARLDDRFQLLTGGSRAALPRHQTLRALIDWSYDSLPAAEAALLRRLSVFAGGWTLEAAEAVCGEEGVQVFRCSGVQADKGSPALDSAGPEDLNTRTPEHPPDVLDLLDALEDRSLVLAEPPPAGGPGTRGTRVGAHEVGSGQGLRYRMLETVREYAREKLRAGGEEETARDQHLAYFLQRAEASGPSPAGPDPAAALALVESEIDNFRAAMAWAQAQRPPTRDYLRLAAALWPFWEMRGYHMEGREYLRAALSQSALPEAPERAQLFLGAAALAFVQAKLAEALALGRESLERFRALDDPRGMAGALVLLGHVSLEHGEIAAARALLAEGLEYCRHSGWTQGSARAFMCLGAAAEGEGDPLLARSLYEQGLSLAEAVEDAATVAFSLRHLGELALQTGDCGRAGSLLEKSLQIWRRLGHKHQTSLTLRSLGWWARRQEDLAAALSYLEETVAICREQGNQTHLAIALCELGSVLYEQGAYERARPPYAESVDLFTQVDSGWAPGARNNLGSTLFHLGDPAGAQALHREALAIYHRGQSAEGVTWTLERLAILEGVYGDAARAARMLGAAATARDALGVPRARWDQSDWERATATARAALGPEAFAAAWAEGRAMSTQQAVEDALREGAAWAGGGGPV